MTFRSGLRVLSGLSLALSLGACGDDGDNGAGGQNQAIGNADCSDPKNPYAEIECVNTFMGDCFVPVGMCMGVVSTAELGKTTLTWESGHSIEADPYYDLGSIDFTDPQAIMNSVQNSSGADIAIYGATGSLCATGVERMNEMQADGTTCAVHTVYTSSLTGQTLTYCFDEAGNGSVTCSATGETHQLSNAKNYSNCASGSQASGTCTIEVEQLDTSMFPGGAFPGQ